MLGGHGQMVGGRVRAAAEGVTRTSLDLAVFRYRRTPGHRSAEAAPVMCRVTYFLEDYQRSYCFFTWHKWCDIARKMVATLAKHTTYLDVVKARYRKS